MDELVLKVTAIGLCVVVWLLVRAATGGADEHEADDDSGASGAD